MMPVQFLLFQLPNNPNVVMALSLLAYMALVAFFALLVWGIMRARTGEKIPYLPLLLRGLVSGLLPLLAYAASGNDELAGRICGLVFLIGVPAVMMLSARRDARKMKGE